MRNMDRSRVGDILLPIVALAGVGCGPPGGPSIDGGNEDDTDGDSNDPASGSTDPDTGDGDGVPPQLLSAATDKTGAFLLLRFSEPMADPAGVDPADFRISWAMTSAYCPYYSSGCWIEESSWYAEPNQYFSPYSPAFDAIAISAGSQPTDLFVKFDAPLHPIVCINAAIIQQDLEDLNHSAEHRHRAALFPHYSPGATPVRSVEGETLASIGPEWVEMPLDQYSSFYEYGFPYLSPQVPIICNVEP